MLIGKELAKNTAYGPMERAYISLLGYPALGLHVRAKAVIPLLDRLTTPKRVLDAGCGKGCFTFAVARRFPQAQVVGIDSDPEAIETNRRVARACGIDNCTFVATDVLGLSQDGSFDCILSTDCLEHVPDDRGVLSAFHGALSENGDLIAHVPHTTRNVFGLKRRNFMGIEGHVRPGYTREGLEKMIGEAGFRIVESGYNYNSIETLLNDLSYLITEGRERRKALYAVVFPALLALTAAFTYTPRGAGSGVVVHARKGAQGHG